MVSGTSAQSSSGIKRNLLSSTELLSAMPIQSLQLTNVGPFRRRADGGDSDRAKLEFDPQINLLIGPNNVGKSTVLQVLASAVAGRNSVIGALPPSFTNAIFDDRLGQGRPDAEIELVWSNSLGDYRNFWSILGPHWERDFSDGLASLQIGGRGGPREIEDFNWDDYAQEFGYVCYYNPALAQTSSIYSTGRYMGLMPRLPKMVGDDADDANVYAAVSMKLTGQAYEKDIPVLIDQVISEIGEGFNVEMGVGIFADDPEADSREWRAGQGKFASLDGELTFPELSHGTRSVFAWVSQFVLGMARHHEADKYGDWKMGTGILIIDEIDAHLHPSWQRRIMPTLQRHFPNVQIFASTHSPMMVAGLRAGQVHLLKRDETGRVAWSRNDQDIIGWTADEIYRAFMGIDDPTDALTVQRADRLRELRDQGSRTEAEEAEMNALRRQVNEDLLAKGRINAQQERYAGLMEQFLRSRMDDLSQDGA